MQFLKTRKMIIVFLAVIMVGAISTAVFLKYDKGDDILRASANDNVHGFAWSELYGWISFNSSDCDTDNNTFVDVACDGDNTTKNVKGYGVKIDVNNGDTNGYAWNPLLGYICFGNTCVGNNPEGNPASANYDRATEKLSGWAKILSQGDNGWIRFDNVATSSNGVFIDSTTGISTGWAWGGNGEPDGDPLTFDGIGWISFSSLDCDINDDGVMDSCATIGSSTSKYAVAADINRPPSLSGVDVDYTGTNDPCLPGNSITNVTLKWNFTDDDVQSGYSISLIPAHAGPFNASTTNQNASMSVLHYNQEYTYTLIVYDSGNPALSTSTTGTFTTKANEYPDVSFSWYAPNPSAEEEIMFTGVSKFYNGGAASFCTTANCTWSWTTSVPTDVINSSTASSTMINFAQKTDDTVTFTATSTADNLSCSTSTTISVSEKLPDWQER